MAFPPPVVFPFLLLPFLRAALVRAAAWHGVCERAASAASGGLACLVQVIHCLRAVFVLGGEGLELESEVAAQRSGRLRVGDARARSNSGRVGCGRL